MNQFQKLALGTVQFGMHYGISNKTGKTTVDDVRVILNYAHDKGITVLDTAIGYGDSELILGQLNQNRFEIVTKFLPEAIEGKIEDQLNSSLHRLKVDKIYGYLAHRPLDILENKHIWDTILKLRNQNKIAKIGFSFNEPLEYFLLKDKGLTPDLVQLPYNYFDNRFTQVIEDLKANKCEIHSRSTFLQGLFFMEPQQLSQHFKAAIPHISALQKKFEHRLPGVLLNYVLSNPLIDKVVLGIQNLEQLRLNLSELDLTEPIEECPVQLEDSILQPSKWIL